MSSMDAILQKYYAPCQVAKLPRPWGWFLGQNSNKPEPQRHAISVFVEIWVSTFAGVALLSIFFKYNIFHLGYVNRRPDFPIIITSYGATAILCFNTVALPFSQPRNVVFGHFVSSLIGIIVARIFSITSSTLDPKSDSSLQWLSGAISVAFASIFMKWLNCVHPPAGASALLPSLEPSVIAMGWWYLPTHLLSGVVTLVVCLVCNNVLRTYPSYWWYPGVAAKESKPAKKEKMDVNLGKKAEPEAVTETETETESADLQRLVAAINEQLRTKSVAIENGVVKINV